MRLRFKKNRGAIFNIVMCVFIVISILITKFGLSDKYPESMALVWGVVITIWLFTLAFSYMHYKYEIVFFSISYIINLLYHCYLIKGNSLQNPDLSGDASGFWQVANQYYEGFFNRVYTKLPYIINAEFHVFGVNYFCCILINIAMSMITIIITTNVLRKLSLSRTTRLFLTLLIGLFPFSFIMSTSLWREPIYLLCLTASFAIFCDYVVSNNKVLFYVALILLMPVLFMHIGYFPIIVVYFYMFFVIQKIKTKKEFIKMLLQIVVLFIVCVVVMGFDSISYIVGKGSGGIEGMMEALIDDGTVSTGGSAYLTNIQANTLGKVIIYAPLKWFYYSFSPLMSNWRGISDIVTFFSDSIIHIYFYLYSILVYKRYKKHLGTKNFEMESKFRILVVGILCVFLCGVVFSQGTSTAGTAVRHRDVLMGVQVITLGVAMSLRKDMKISRDEQMNRIRG